MLKIDVLVNDGELTLSEGQVLNWLLHYGYFAEKHFSDVWVRDISYGVEKDIKIVRGIVGSLIKKDYLYLDKVDESDKESIVYATERLYELDDDENRWTDSF
jgi:hypothetical protein